MHRSDRAEGFWLGWVLYYYGESLSLYPQRTLIDGVDLCLVVYCAILLSHVLYTKSMAV